MGCGATRGHTPQGGLPSVVASGLGVVGVAGGVVSGFGLHCVGVGLYWG